MDFVVHIRVGKYILPADWHIDAFVQFVMFHCSKIGL